MVGTLFYRPNFDFLLSLTRFSEAKDEYYFKFCTIKSYHRIRIFRLRISFEGVYFQPICVFATASFCGI